MQRGVHHGLLGPQRFTDAVEDCMWYNLATGGKRSVNREQGSRTSGTGHV